METQIQIHEKKQKGDVSKMSVQQDGSVVVLKENKRILQSYSQTARTEQKLLSELEETQNKQLSIQSSLLNRRATLEKLEVIHIVEARFNFDMKMKINIGRSIFFALNELFNHLQITLQDFEKSANAIWIIFDNVRTQYISNKKMLMEKSNLPTLIDEASRKSEEYLSGINNYNDECTRLGKKFQSILPEQSELQSNFYVKQEYLQKLQKEYIKVKEETIKVENNKSKIKKNLNDIYSQINKETAQISDIQAQQKHILRQNNRLQSKIVKKIKNNTTKNKISKQKFEQIRDVHQEIKKCKIQAQNLQKNIKKSHSIISKLEKENSKIVSNISAQEEGTDKICDKISSITFDIKDKEDQLNNEKSSNMYLKAQLMDLNEEISQLRESEKFLIARNMELLGKSKELSSKRENYENNLEMLLQKIESETNRKVILENELLKLNQQHHQQLVEEKEKNKKIERLQYEYLKTNELLQRTKKECENKVNDALNYVAQCKDTSNKKIAACESEIEYLKAQTSLIQEKNRNMEIEIEEKYLYVQNIQSDNVKLTKELDAMNKVRRQAKQNSSNKVNLDHKIGKEGFKTAKTLEKKQRRTSARNYSDSDFDSEIP